MDNRERRAILVRAMDTIMEIPFMKDDINDMIDEAYNALDLIVEVLADRIDEEEDDV